jgi:glycine/D-amino acid oxidase-like deaminating enzyme
MKTDIPQIFLVDRGEFRIYSILGNKDILDRVDLISWEMLKSFPHSFQENRELDPSTNIYFILFLSGKHPVLHNVFMACGFSGHGIQQV